MEVSPRVPENSFICRKLLNRESQNTNLKKKAAKPSSKYQGIKKKGKHIHFMLEPYIQL